MPDAARNIAEQELMPESKKPAFLIRKYHRILRAAIVVEAITYLASLTDSVVAGHAIGAEALAAVNLVSPMLLIITFLGGAINTGTVLRYSYYVGRFDRERAHEIFSEGCIMAVAVGILLSALFYGLEQVFLSWMALSEALKQYVHNYYVVAALYAVAAPLGFLLDNIVIADGGEKLSAAANVIYILGNIFFSLLFSQRWGIKGVAAATVLSVVLFDAVICLWFFRKKNTLRFRLKWCWKDAASICGNGFVRASCFAMTALMVFVFNLFLSRRYPQEMLTVFSIVQKVLGASVVFLGFSMAAQPLFGTLQGEENTAELRALTRVVIRNMILAGILISALLIGFAPLIVRLFGINSGDLFDRSVSAVRVVGSTMVFQGLCCFFFIYYLLIGKKGISFLACFLKDFAAPVGTGILCSLLFAGEHAVWWGIAAAPPAALAVLGLTVRRRYGKAQFPFLMAETKGKTSVFDLEITPDRTVRLSGTVMKMLKAAGFSTRSQTLSGVLTEEMLMLISERNKESRKQNRAAVTVILEDRLARLIFRYEGKAIDFSARDERIDSLRQYFVETVSAVADGRIYMLTTGYNRNELDIRDITLAEKTGNP